MAGVVHSSPHTTVEATSGNRYPIDPGLDTGVQAREQDQLTIVFSCAAGVRQGRLLTLIPESSQSSEVHNLKVHNLKVHNLPRQGTSDRQTDRHP